MGNKNTSPNSDSFDKKRTFSPSDDSVIKYDQHRPMAPVDHFYWSAKLVMVGPDKVGKVVQ